MRVFALLVLGVMGCSLAGARIVSKCELRDKLRLAIANLPEKAQQAGLSGESLVAKIVCHVEQASGFNTSAVIERKGDTGDHGSSGGPGHGAGQMITAKPVTRVPREAPKQHGSENGHDGHGVGQGAGQTSTGKPVTQKQSPAPELHRSGEKGHGSGPAITAKPITRVPREAFKPHDSEKDGHGFAQASTGKPVTQKQGHAPEQHSSEEEGHGLGQASTAKPVTRVRRAAPKQHGSEEDGHGVGQGAGQTSTGKPVTQKQSPAPEQHSSEEADEGSAHVTGHPAKRVQRQAPEQQSSEEDDDSWTLYGLFQLSSPLVCSDGTATSPNICNMSCNNLTDDNITDDISCVLKILEDLIEQGFRAPYWNDLKKMIRFILQDSCKNVQAGDYFSGCQ